jgi:hypothetical protein
VLIENSSSMGACVIQKTFWHESVVNSLSVIQIMFKKFLVLYRNAQANIRGISKQKAISKSFACFEFHDLFRNNSFFRNRWPVSK